MNQGIPNQVTDFAHVLAGYYASPLVGLPRTLGDFARVTASLARSMRHLVSGTGTVDCEQENARVLLCRSLLNRTVNVEDFLSQIEYELEDCSLAILCARDRERSPESASQWTPLELKALLTRRGIRVLFIGHTAATKTDSARKIIVAILAGRKTPLVSPPPANFKVVALISSFNEADIIGPSLDHWLQQDVRVYLLDNWSTDGTYDIAAACEGRGVRVERFPSHGRGEHYLIGPILRRKEELAKQLDADWFIHADVDEMREGPFPDGKIREALYHAERSGFNCVESTLLEFRPVDNSYVAGSDLRSHFRFWQPGTHPYDYVQRKIWKKTSAAVNLASGGHDVLFPGRKIYPFHFLLRHYPFRSTQQAKRKLLEERKVDPEERRLKGWGAHYDIEKSRILEAGLRRKEDLQLFNSSFYDDYLIERLSAVGLRPSSRST